jgi:hypothetical protein
VVRAMVGASSPASLLTPEERPAEHSHAAASLGGREEERRAERAPGCDVAAMARVGGLWSHGALAVVPRKDVSAVSSGVISAVSSGVSSDGPSDEPEPAGIEGPRPIGVLGVALGTALDLRLSDNAFTRSAI